MVLSRARDAVVSAVESDRRVSDPRRLILGERRQRSRRLPWIASAAVVFMASAVATTFLNSRPSASRQGTAVTPASQNASLGLGIHVQGDDFLITWDREAPGIHAAARGVLRIQDGSERRITDLQPAELANGSIMYRPSSDDVDFLLSVYARDGSVTKESERALDGRRSSTAGVPDGAPQLVPAASRRGSSERKSSALRREPSKSAGRTSQSDPLRRGETMPDYVAPQPLKVVMPDVARLTEEDLPASGKIVVEVEVDEQGRVKAARIPAGAPKVSSAAARAAIAAAKQWGFEPAKLRGKSVASRHQVIFDIQPGAH
jgi:TonB family protein